MDKKKKYRVALMQATTRNGRTSYSFLKPLPVDDTRANITQTYGRASLLTSPGTSPTDSGVRFSILSRSIN